MDRPSPVSFTCTICGGQSCFERLLPFSRRADRASVGLTVGKAWERYKLRAGRLIDRRRAPESLHYIARSELPRHESD